MADDTSPTPWGRPGQSGRRDRGGPPAPPPGSATAPGGGPPPAPAPTPSPTDVPPPAPVPTPPAGVAGALPGAPHTGMSGGALIALAAVVVAALVATGVGVFLVTRADDTAADSTTTSPPAATSGPATTPADPSTTAGGAASTSGPGTTAPGGPAATSVPDLPFSGLSDPLPESFPTPAGARTGAIGVEVDTAVDEVAAFYRASLAGAGFTVADGEGGLGGAQNLVVEGNGLSGQLVLIDVAGPTTIVWVAS